MKNFRKFSLQSPLLGKTYQVEFAWLQNAISIRHSDTVDVKFFVTDGDRTLERVVALPHAVLRKLCQELGRELTDPWCSRLAALHLKWMFESGTDIEKAISTPTEAQLREYAHQLARPSE